MTIRTDGGPAETSFRHRTDALVFETSRNWDDEDAAYPSVWVSEPVEDLDGNRLGRTYVMRYPSPDDPDPDGWLALRLGGTYYDEGMGYSDAGDRQTRVDCFRAAELLYLHAAERGNPVAWLCLGYVYSYDRCEGAYYRADAQGFSREAEAFVCYKKAAEADIAEACYKLGDMYKHGTGCDPDAAEAFGWYRRAFELGRGERPVMWGSAALRLADCYENALGCQQSFAHALKWYRKAVTGLEIAVREGDWYYRRALTNAQDGVKRCMQEKV